VFSFTSTNVRYLSRDFVTFGDCADIWVFAKYESTLHIIRPAAGSITDVPQDINLQIALQLFPDHGLATYHRVASINARAQAGQVRSAMVRLSFNASRYCII
jgi:hypothetical protein